MYQKALQKQQDEINLLRQQLVLARQKAKVNTPKQKPVPKASPKTKPKPTKSK
jgi:hypothetical protein